MYEHPYLVHIVNQVDLDRRTAQLERARQAREQPERLVPRRSWIDRMLHRARPENATPSHRASDLPASGHSTAGRSASDRPMCAAAPGRVAAEIT